jgi:hypothetical protein
MIRQKLIHQLATLLYEASDRSTPFRDFFESLMTKHAKTQPRTIQRLVTKTEYILRNKAVK